MGGTLSVNAYANTLVARSPAARRKPTMPGALGACFKRQIILEDELPWSPMIVPRTALVSEHRRL